MIKYQQNIKGLLDFAAESKENRQALDRVTNVLNKNPPLFNAILNAAEQGFHASYGATSASIGAPVKKFLENLNTPQDQKVAQMLMLAIDNANFINAKLNGMSTTANLPAAEANIIASGMLSRDMNLGSLLHSLVQVKNNLDMYSDLYKGYKNLYSKYGNELNPLAANYQIVNSDWWNKTRDRYANISNNYTRTYNRGMAMPQGQE